ncbi:MAG TPA: pyridoxal phosphate-dependent aminotransferase [Myxococcales bacterium]|nr:pyridoxal phosphate-dependent aminotransferase [Myxococcales bacterium]
MTTFSRRVLAAKPSASLAVTARAIQLKREGREIVSLSVGEPDFPVFPHVAQAVEDALRKGYTKYTPSSGIAELREAISDWVQGEIGQRYTVAQIICTAGAKQALYNACQALLDEGDEAVIPNPYWVSYPDIVRLAGARPVEMMTRAEDEWHPDPEALARVVTPRTKVVMLGSPSNPTGAVWSTQAMKGIARVLDKHPQITILSDDIYHRLVYGGTRAGNILQVAPQLRDRTVLINGCSKAYAMTGLRLGWACGPQEIISAMNKVQDSSTSNPNSLTQYAAVAALRGPQDGVESMRAQFERRRDLMVELVRAIPRVRCARPEGAYYVFCDVSAYLGRVPDDVKLTQVLLEEHGVAVVPGSAFGQPGYLRLSFATSEPQIRAGIERMSRGLQSLV